MTRLSEGALDDFIDFLAELYEEEGLPEYKAIDAALSLVNSTDDDVIDDYLRMWKRGRDMDFFLQLVADDIIDD